MANNKFDCIEIEAKPVELLEVREMTNACPRCSRPLDPAEEFCPSCRSEKDRKMKEEVLLFPDPLGLKRHVLCWTKKEVDEEKRLYIASALTGWFPTAPVLSDV